MEWHTIPQRAKKSAKTKMIRKKMKLIYKSLISMKGELVKNDKIHAYSKNFPEDII